MFQSTPAIADGRTRMAMAACSALRSFNPRPPSLTGEPGFHVPSFVPRARFNPRPPSLTGEPRVGAGLFGLTEVSIHARHR